MTSHLNLRALLQTTKTPHLNRDIEFIDVSSRQQRDASSCGVFALENANR